MRNYLLVIFISIFILSCSEEQKKENVMAIPVSKKEEYLKPKNTLYDSTSGTYSAGAPFDSIGFVMGYILPGSRSFVALNNVMLMQDSLLKVPLGVKLKIGDSVLVEYYINTEYNYEDWSEPVYKVKVKREGEEFSGYLPQKSIAIAAKRLSDNNILIIRLSGFFEGVDNSNDFNAEVIVVDSTYKVIKKEIFALIGGEPDQQNRWHYYYTVISQLLPAKGLEGAVDIINLSMNYPACGYAGGDLVLAWDGASIHYLLEDSDGSDAGVYSQQSSIILPGDNGGNANKILSITNTVVYEFDEKDVYKELEHDSLVVQCFWEKEKGITKRDTLYSTKK